MERWNWGGSGGRGVSVREGGGGACSRPEEGVHEVGSALGVQLPLRPPISADQAHQLEPSRNVGANHGGYQTGLYICVCRDAGGPEATRALR